MGALFFSLCQAVRLGKPHDIKGERHSEARAPSDLFVFATRCCLRRGVFTARPRNLDKQLWKNRFSVDCVHRLS